VDAFALDCKKCMSYDHYVKKAREEGRSGKEIEEGVEFKDGK